MKNYVVTIARGFGSGGKEIGMKLAERLGIPCYEHQLLKLASEKSGLEEGMFVETDERLKGAAWTKLLRGIPFHYVVEPEDKRFCSDDNLYNIQAEIVRELADTTSCVIIGKCSDYILRDKDNVISFYVEAPRDACVKSIMSKLQVNEEEANKMITKTDKYRANYYRYYTDGEDWQCPVNYDMTLNSARIGRDNCVDIMEHYVKYKLEGK